MDNNNFNSIDRLIEFGLSMAVAQQMVKSMNEAMSTAYIPGAQNTMNNPTQKKIPERVYYAVFEGKQAGPFSETEIARLIGDKKLSKETLVWHPGLDNWKPVENIPEILRLVALAPPAIGG
jgi:hypothetical protein